jgi:putative cell wall-binding protein
VPITVLAGHDRIETAIAASQNAFSALTAQAVVIARSDGFADALAGSPLAVAKGGPLLLNPTALLDPRVEAEVKRALGAGGTVYLLGGDVALSPAVATALAADGFKVVRLGGINRFATAVDVANAIGAPATVLLATGMNAADALVAGAAAAKVSAVVLLSNDGVMPPETQAFLASDPGATVYAIGGPAAAADPSALAIVGGNRYTTGVMVAQAFFGTPEAIGFASGISFADALAGGTHIGLHGGPLILVDPNTIDPTVRAYLGSVGGGIAAAFAYGGPFAIPTTMITALSSALAGK